MPANYRQLTEAEISRMETQGCQCADWSGVKVRDGFSAERVHRVEFIGSNKLGRYTKATAVEGGFARPTGIYNAVLNNCTVGDEVLVRNVKGSICNYTLEDSSIVDNVDSLIADADAKFGNGVDVAVVNEAGGRDVRIYDGLTAQIAYLIAFYRHDEVLLNKLYAMIDAYVEKATPNCGIVESNARITNCGKLRNVRIGAGAEIEGALSLTNGSVNSCVETATLIGPGVIGSDFIVGCCSVVSGGANLKKCFVGQGCVIDKGFTAENSLFFANSEFLQGEGCSIFAGPYTVSHHKSSLLIAGYFSFFNAGSGTNQSNHFYKIGPVHQGITERGCKTGSGGYILWPSRIGAFSMVTGKHTVNMDTSMVPFSYVVERNGGSTLLPGRNLRTIGIVRDEKKWSRRERRKCADKLDIVNSRVFTPYAFRRVLELLKRGDESEFLSVLTGEVVGLAVSQPSADKGRDIYEMGIDEFVGNRLLQKLENMDLGDRSVVQESVANAVEHGRGAWVDLAGLLCPESALQQILSDIRDGGTCELGQLRKQLQELADNYHDYEWGFALECLEYRLGKPADTLTVMDIAKFLERYKDSAEKMWRLRLADAGKDFGPAVKIGYGIDGDDEIAAADFEAVRGKLGENNFIVEAEREMKARFARVDTVLSKLRR